MEYLLELANFINTLNKSVYDHLEVLPGRETHPFCLETDGETIVVYFLDQVIWNSYRKHSEEICIEIRQEIIDEAQEILENFQSMKIKDMK